MKICLESGDLAAVIDPMGAEPVSVRFRGVERLWQNENGAWAGHAPVLFPLCGECAAVFGGWRSPMKRHGFARRCVFTPVAQGADFAKFCLTANEETRALYPFEFELSVTYTLRGDTLEIGYEVKNSGDGPLSFGWGGHLSHTLFSPLGGHTLRFSEAEDLTALLHDENGHLTGETLDMGRGKSLSLTEEFFRGSRTMILGGIASRRVELLSPAGKLAELAFEGFSNLLLWRPGDARMICVEPWSNLPDRAGEEEKEFCRKDGVLTLPAGGSARAMQKITYFGGTS